MDEQTRRAWSRPELIVIVRSGPEEAVLVACKVVHGPGTVFDLHNGCQTDWQQSCDSQCFSHVES